MDPKVMRKVERTVRSTWNPETRCKFRSTPHLEANLGDNVAKSQLTANAVPW